jgi:2-polyprenyl-3-methyl-5-hydroxy-6-metoxy-1,4-benzoquinol methylase
MLARRGENPHKVAILEIGCGVGNIAIPLASMGYSITAVDIHEASVAIAARNNTFANASFLARDFRELDVSRFDAIILTEVLEHVCDYDAMIRDIATRIRPGAGLIVTVPNGWGITEMILRPSYSLKRFTWWGAIVKRIKKGLQTRDLTTANEQTPHVNFFTESAIARAFSKHGFRCTTFHRYFLKWALYETFFSQHQLDEDRARSDFNRSQSASASRCALWTFLFEKDSK